jgi:hypothetical protein
MGMTGACECVFLRFSQSSSLSPTDTLIRAIGKRAHTFHSIMFFSFSCVLGSALGYASTEPEFSCFLKKALTPTPAWYYLRHHWSFPRTLPGLLCCFSSAYLVWPRRCGLSYPLPQWLIPRGDPSDHGSTTRDGFSGFPCYLYLSMFFTYGSFAVSQPFQIVFAIMFEFIVFHTTPSALSLAGAAIIISSAIYTSVRSSHPSSFDTYSYTLSWQKRPPSNQPLVQWSQRGAVTAHPPWKPRRSAALIAWCNDLSKVLYSMACRSDAKTG